MQRHSSTADISQITDDLPPREPGDKKGAAKSPEKRTNRNTPVQYSFSGAVGEIDAEDVLERVGIDLPEVDDAVSEVEGGEGDVPDDEGDRQLGLVGHPSLHEGIIVFTHATLYRYFIPIILFAYLQLPTYCKNGLNSQKIHSLFTLCFYYPALPPFALIIQPITNSMLIDHPNNLSFQSDHTFSNNTYKSNSNLAEAAKPETCSFCRVKPFILKQLESLREIILAKNDKIKELEGLIQKISNMAFTSTTEQSDQRYITNKNNNQSQPFQELTFAQCELEPHHQSNINSFGQSLRTDSRQSLGSSQISANEKEMIKSSIKREVKRLNMEKGQRVPPKQIQVQYPKESALRAKLLSIMTLLPENQHDSQLQSFQTESEPMGEGPVGLVNSKVSNHKIVKHAGFIKKNDAISQQSVQSFHSTSRSQKMKKLIPTQQQQ